MTAQAKVEQRHRDEAARVYQQCCERATHERKFIAQALANAEAAGYAAGVKDEREECAKWIESQHTAPHFTEQLRFTISAAIRARSDAQEVHDAECESEFDSQVHAHTPCGCESRRAAR